MSKKFAKNNKRLSYSVALLITFLINGGFSYADEAVQIPLRTEIKTRIEKEQANISKMLKETDASMKDIELRIKKLTQRGTFCKTIRKIKSSIFLVNWEIIVEIGIEMKVISAVLNIQHLLDVIWDMDNI